MSDGEITVSTSFSTQVQNDETSVHNRIIIENLQSTSTSSVNHGIFNEEPCSKIKSNKRPGGAINNVILEKKKKKENIEPPKLVEPNRDIFCWKCHKFGNDVMKCNNCPRVYHFKCTQLEVKHNNWTCFQCLDIQNYKTDKRIMAQNLKSSDYCKLLEFALKRMWQHEGCSYFENPVDLEQYPEYLTYIVNPKCISEIEEKVTRCEYSCCEAFLADIRWLVHNSYIFNGAHSELTLFARTLLKMAKQECEEMVNCPDCYQYANTLDDDKWFIELCEDPHVLVWAKLKGFPYWPGKVINSSSSTAEVRFFGDHNKAAVPIDACFLYSKHPPKKQKRDPSLESAMEEALKHIQKLQDRFGEFHYPPPGIEFKNGDKDRQIKIFIPGFDMMDSLPGSPAPRIFKLKRRSSDVEPPLVNKARFTHSANSIDDVQNRAALLQNQSSNKQMLNKHNLPRTCYYESCTQLKVLSDFKGHNTFSRKRMIDKPMVVLKNLKKPLIALENLNLDPNKSYIVRESSSNSISNLKGKNYIIDEKVKESIDKQFDTCNENHNQFPNSTDVLGKDNCENKKMFTGATVNTSVTAILNNYEESLNDFPVNTENIANISHTSPISKETKISLLQSSLLGCSVINKETDKNNHGSYSIPSSISIPQRCSTNKPDLNKVFKLQAPKAILVVSKGSQKLSDCPSQILKISKENVSNTKLETLANVGNKHPITLTSNAHAYEGASKSLNQQISENKSINNISIRENSLNDFGSNNSKPPKIEVKSCNNNEIIASNSDIVPGHNQLMESRKGKDKIISDSGKCCDDTIEQNRIILKNELPIDASLNDFSNTKTYVIVDKGNSGENSLSSQQNNIKLRNVVITGNVVALNTARRELPKDKVQLIRFYKSPIKKASASDRLCSVSERKKNILAFFNSLKTREDISSELKQKILKNIHSKIFKNRSSNFESVGHQAPGHGCNKSNNNIETQNKPKVLANLKHSSLEIVKDISKLLPSGDEILANESQFRNENNKKNNKGCEEMDKNKTRIINIKKDNLGLHKEDQMNNVRHAKIELDNSISNNKSISSRVLNVSDDISEKNSKETVDILKKNPLISEKNANARENNIIQKEIQSDKSVRLNIENIISDVNTLLGCGTPVDVVNKSGNNDVFANRTCFQKLINSGKTASRASSTTGIPKKADDKVEVTKIDVFDKNAKCFLGSTVNETLTPKNDIKNGYIHSPREKDSLIETEVIKTSYSTIPKEGLEDKVLEENNQKSQDSSCTASHMNRGSASSVKDFPSFFRSDMVFQRRIIDFLNCLNSNKPFAEAAEDFFMKKVNEERINDTVIPEAVVSGKQQISPAINNTIIRDDDISIHEDLTDNCVRSDVDVRTLSDSSSSDKSKKFTLEGVSSIEEDKIASRIFEPPVYKGKGSFIDDVSSSETTSVNVILNDKKEKHNEEPLELMELTSLEALKKKNNFLMSSLDTIDIMDKSNAESILEDIIPSDTNIVTHGIGGNNSVVEESSSKSDSSLEEKRHIANFVSSLQTNKILANTVRALIVKNIYSKTGKNGSISSKAKVLPSHGKRDISINISRQDKLTSKSDAQICEELVKNCENNEALGWCSAEVIKEASTLCPCDETNEKSLEMFENVAASLALSKSSESSPTEDPKIIVKSHQSDSIAERNTADEERVTNEEVLSKVPLQIELSGNQMLGHACNSPPVQKGTFDSDLQIKSQIDEFLNSVQKNQALANSVKTKIINNLYSHERPSFSHNFKPDFHNNIGIRKETSTVPDNKDLLNKCGSMASSNVPLQIELPSNQTLEHASNSPPVQKVALDSDLQMKSQIDEFLNSVQKNQALANSVKTKIINNLYSSESPIFNHDFKSDFHNNVEIHKGSSAEPDNKGLLNKCGSMASSNVPLQIELPSNQTLEHASNSPPVQKVALDSDLQMKSQIARFLNSVQKNQALANSVKTKIINNLYSHESPIFNHDFKSDFHNNVEIHKETSTVPDNKDLLNKCGSMDSKDGRILGPLNEKRKCINPSLNSDSINAIIINEPPVANLERGFDANMHSRVRKISEHNNDKYTFDETSKVEKISGVKSDGMPQIMIKQQRSSGEPALYNNNLCRNRKLPDCTKHSAYEKTETSSEETAFKIGCKNEAGLFKSASKDLIVNNSISFESEDLDESEGLSNNIITTLPAVVMEQVRAAKQDSSDLKKLETFIKQNNLKDNIAEIVRAQFLAIREGLLRKEEKSSCTKTTDKLKISTSGDSFSANISVKNKQLLKNKSYSSQTTCVASEELSEITKCESNLINETPKLINIQESDRNIEGSSSMNQFSDNLRINQNDFIIKTKELIRSRMIHKHKLRKVKNSVSLMKVLKDLNKDTILHRNIEKAINDSSFLLNEKSEIGVLNLHPKGKPGNEAIVIQLGNWVKPVAPEVLPLIDLTLSEYYPSQHNNHTSNEMSVSLNNDAKEVLLRNNNSSFASYKIGDDEFRVSSNQQKATKKEEVHKNSCDHNSISDISCSGINSEPIVFSENELPTSLKNNDIEGAPFTKIDDSKLKIYSNKRKTTVEDFKNSCDSIVISKTQIKENELPTFQTDDVIGVSLTTSTLNSSLTCKNKFMNIKLNEHNSTKDCKHPSDVNMISESNNTEINFERSEITKSERIGDKESKKEQTHTHFLENNLIENVGMKQKDNEIIELDCEEEEETSLGRSSLELGYISNDKVIMDLDQRKSLTESEEDLYGGDITETECDSLSEEEDLLEKDQIQLPKGKIEASQKVIENEANIEQYKEKTTDIGSKEQEDSFSEGGYVAEREDNVDEEDSEDDLDDEGSEHNVDDEDSEDDLDEEGSENNVDDEDSEDDLDDEGSEHNVNDEASEDDLGDEGPDHNVDDKGSEDNFDDEGSEHKIDDEASEDNLGAEGSEHNIDDEDSEGNLDDEGSEDNLDEGSDEECFSSNALSEKAHGKKPIDQKFQMLFPKNAVGEFINDQDDNHYIYKDGFINFEKTNNLLEKMEKLTISSEKEVIQSPLDKSAGIAGTASIYNERLTNEASFLEIESSSDENMSVLDSEEDSFADLEHFLSIKEQFQTPPKLQGEALKQQLVGINNLTEIDHNYTPIISSPHKKVHNKIGFRSVTSPHGLKLFVAKLKESLPYDSDMPTFADFNYGQYDLLIERINEYLQKESGSSGEKSSMLNISNLKLKDQVHLRVIHHLKNLYFTKYSGCRNQLLSTFLELLKDLPCLVNELDRHSHEDYVDEVMEKCSATSYIVSKNYQPELNSLKMTRFCSYCKDPATLHCCFTASYCSPECKANHLDRHKETCVDISGQLEDRATVHRPEILDFIKENKDITVKEFIEIIETVRLRRLFGDDEDIIKQLTETINKQTMQPENEVIEILSDSETPIEISTDSESSFNEESQTCSENETDEYNDLPLEVIVNTNSGENLVECNSKSLQGTPKTYRNVIPSNQRITKGYMSSQASGKHVRSLSSDNSTVYGMSNKKHVVENYISTASKPGQVVYWIVNKSSNSTNHIYSSSNTNLKTDSSMGKNLNNIYSSSTNEKVTYSSKINSAIKNFLSKSHKKTDSCMDDKGNSKTKSFPSFSKTPSTTDHASSKEITNSDKNNGTVNQTFSNPHRKTNYSMDGRENSETNIFPACFSYRGNTEYNINPVSSNEATYSHKNNRAVYQTFSTPHKETDYSVDVGGNSEANIVPTCSNLSSVSNISYRGNPECKISSVSSYVEASYSPKNNRAAYQTFSTPNKETEYFTGVIRNPVLTTFSKMPSGSRIRENTENNIYPTFSKAPQGIYSHESNEKFTNMYICTPTSGTTDCGMSDEKILENSISSASSSNKTDVEKVELDKIPGKFFIKVRDVESINNSISIACDKAVSNNESESVTDKIDSNGLTHQKNVIKNPFVHESNFSKTNEVSTNANNKNLELIINNKNILHIDQMAGSLMNLKPGIKKLVPNKDISLPSRTPVPPIQGTSAKNSPGTSEVAATGRIKLQAPNKIPIRQGKVTKNVLPQRNALICEIKNNPNTIMKHVDMKKQSSPPLNSSPTSLKPSSSVPNNAKKHEYFLISEKNANGTSVYKLVDYEYLKNSKTPFLHIP